MTILLRINSGAELFSTNSYTGNAPEYCFWDKCERLGLPDIASEISGA